MAMFNRYPNLFFEDNRILDVKTIDGNRVGPIFAATGDDAPFVAAGVADELRWTALAAFSRNGGTSQNL